MCVWANYKDTSVRIFQKENKALLHSLHSVSFPFGISSKLGRHETKILRKFSLVFGERSLGAAEGDELQGPLPSEILQSCVLGAALSSS